MKELLSILIMPIPILYLLLLAALFFHWRRRQKTCKIFILFAFCWVLVITTRPIPVLLLKSLENRYFTFNEPGIIDATKTLNILVLAAGHTDDASLQPNNQLSIVGLGRLTEGVRLYKKFPESRLILSGPGGKPGLTQADALMKTAMLMGVEKNDVSFLNRPLNTAGEAREYNENFGTENQLIIVTSAIHMPRAVVVFRKTGLDPIPAPTNNIIKKGSKKSPWRWVPSVRNISMIEAAFYEYAGLLWTYLAGL